MDDLGWTRRTRHRARAALLALGCAIAVEAEGQRPAAYATDAAIPQARPYAAGVITTVNGLAFDPDGRTLYVSRAVDDLDGRGRRRVRIFRYRFAGGRWSAAEAVSFSAGFTDYQPVLGPDGSRMFFTSTRPLPGTSVEARQNIWVVDRVGGGWGAPRAIVELASPVWDGYAVPTRSGRLYFVSERAGGRGAVDIWTADPSADGGYAEPVNVAPLNSAHSDSDIYVDPDERFIIFHRFVEADRSMDFWMAFRAGGVWRAPRLLGEVNGPGWELSPTVTPDGRYFFFNRDGVVHQIDFCALVRAEERAFLSSSGTSCNPP